MRVLQKTHWCQLIQTRGLSRFHSRKSVFGSPDRFETIRDRDKCQVPAPLTGWVHWATSFPGPFRVWWRGGKRFSFSLRGTPRSPVATMNCKLCFNLHCHSQAIISLRTKPRPVPEASTNYFSILFFSEKCIFRFALGLTVLDSKLLALFLVHLCLNA